MVNYGEDTEEMKLHTQSEAINLLSTSLAPPVSPLFLARYSMLLGKYTAFFRIERM